MFEVEIIGTGSYAPLNIMTNYDVEKFLDTSDEWISTRTGIKERRISTEENTSHIAYKAAKEALMNASINANEIDLIIVATATPDYYIPSTACLVQKYLGADKAAAFDLSAACTGFIYGISTAEQFIKTGQYETVLVIGAEVLSKIIDWQDRNTAVLFGDGAGAVVLRRSTKNGIIKTFLGSDGNKGENLEVKAVPVRNINVKNEEVYESFIAMNGKEIFKFAVKVMPDSVNEMLQYTGLSLEDIKYIVPHQANTRIIEYAAKKLNTNIDKFYLNLDRYGNTSGATIPLALDEMAEKNLLKKGDKILLVGFGGGLTWGSALIEWTK